MLNTGEVATAQVATPGGRVIYAGATAIDGVPGTAAAVPLMFENIAGSMTGALLPTGNAVDVIDGVACTLIDNGMPCVVLARRRRRRHRRRDPRGARGRTPRSRPASRRSA